MLNLSWIAKWNKTWLKYPALDLQVMEFLQYILNVWTNLCLTFRSWNSCSIFFMVKMRSWRLPSCLNWLHSPFSQPFFSLPSSLSFWSFFSSSFPPWSPSHSSLDSCSFSPSKLLLFPSLVTSLLSAACSEPPLGDEAADEGLDAKCFWLSREVRGVEAGSVEPEARTSSPTGQDGFEGALLVREGRPKEEGGNNTGLRCPPPVLSGMWVGWAGAGSWAGFTVATDNCCSCGLLERTVLMASDEQNQPFNHYTTWFTLTKG